MGRSRPTYRQSLDNFRDDFEPFRRELRRENQAALDRLYEHGRLHAPSAKMANRGDLETLILLSIALGLQHDILELREELE